MGVLMNSTKLKVYTECIKMQLRADSLYRNHVFNIRQWMRASNMIRNKMSAAADLKDGKS
jgi:hypothetical protein